MLAIFLVRAGDRRFDGVFPESTMIGLFFFGWDRLSKGQHLLVTAFIGGGEQFIGVVDSDCEMAGCKIRSARSLIRSPPHGVDQFFRDFVQSCGAE